MLGRDRYLKEQHLEKKAHTVENLETGKCLLCSVIRRKMNECS